jgi:hypothetical protein
MDEKRIKYPTEKPAFGITWTPQGVAGMWLRANIPDSSREDQLNLGILVEEMWKQGLRTSLEHAIVALKDCPTVSAAEAKLEAMLDELKHAENVKRREEAENIVDFDPTRP